MIFEFRYFSENIFDTKVFRGVKPNKLIRRWNLDGKVIIIRLIFFYLDSSKLSYLLHTDFLAKRLDFYFNGLPYTCSTVVVNKHILMRLLVIQMVKINDIVGRKSHDCDMFFRVIAVENNVAILYGEDFRLVADAPLNDLVIIDKTNYLEQNEKSIVAINEATNQLNNDKIKIQKSEARKLLGESRAPREFFNIPGRVLHLDGDKGYLNKCLAQYKRLNVPVIGIHCHESEMPYRITELLEDYRPDILVITGHDAYSKSKGEKNDMSAYRHSGDFVQTVIEARRRIPHLDQLIIFAGACQSHFESLIRAGANFASSPTRVNIHALDPVYIVAKLSFTPFMESVHVLDVLQNTLTGEKGLGGIETKGVLRVGMPYNEENF